MSTEISIKQLPQVTEINNDDLILVQTPNATNTLLFSNFVIGLDNTTFGSTITQNSTDIETLSSEVNSLSSTLTTDVETISTNLDTISGYYNDRQVLQPRYGGTGLSGVEYFSSYTNACASVAANARVTNIIGITDTCNAWCAAQGEYTFANTGYYEIESSFLSNNASPVDIQVVHDDGTTCTDISRAYVGGATSFNAIQKIIMCFNEDEKVFWCANSTSCVFGDPVQGTSVGGVTIKLLPT